MPAAIKAAQGTEVAEAKPAEVTFLSVRYPSLKVMVKRNPDGGLYSKDIYAQFHGGAYTTADPEVIAKLDTVSEVHRDNGTRYVCPECQFSTRHPKVFARHMQSH